MGPIVLKNTSFESSASNLQHSKHRKKKMSQSRLGESSNSFNNNNFFNNNTNSFNNVCNVNFGGDETAEILAWLSPLEPRIRHQAISEHRVKDVGDWLLQTEEYQDWFNGIHGSEPGESVLFGYGDPGVGKTYIR